MPPSNTLFVCPFRFFVKNASLHHNVFWSIEIYSRSFALQQVICSLLGDNQTDVLNLLPVDLLSHMLRNQFIISFLSTSKYPSVSRKKKRKKQHAMENTISDTNPIITTSSHRPRGRPQGSKNKSKPPVVIAQGTSTALHSNLFEISPDADIISSINSFAKARRRGVSLLSASGAVTNVALRQANGAVVNLGEGKYEILCLNGAVLPPPCPAEASGVSVVLMAEDGGLVGGKVAGELVTVGTVMVVAATFSNSRFQRLPLMEDDVEGLSGEVGKEDELGLKVLY